ELVADTLVLSEHVADLPAPDAYVAGRHVGELPDVATELGHEALAEFHDFHVALAVGIEIRAAPAPAHGKGGERVLENLLEGEEFEQAEVDSGVEAQPSLIGADRA